MADIHDAQHLAEPGAPLPAQAKTWERPELWRLSANEAHAGGVINPDLTTLSS